ncbi:D-alanyl-D-alanine carboxypeptidase family protein [Abyssisolibacter fermentans]|uniref:D-alanyl-D-alanine carboxypeptidase family protein n=1 Tax=Abyssisolibacter fermentans TaxID=1766203 RepID=UPI00082E74B9|nr:D-alanyl-D-alanine carboxypeptidase family protein [Abyssisolibacter fermentans]
MKRKLALFIALILVIIPLTTSHAENSWIAAKSAVLIDADTGTVLAQKNMDKQMYPASTTKIMTGILALENCKLDEVVTVDDKTPYEIEGQQIYLQAGEIITMKDLLNAMLIQSANDAALLIAKHISGSQEEFAKLMNKKAKEIGAKNTNFINPNGLHDDNHVTTAYDMAMIARYAMQNETFRNIVSNYTYTIAPTNKQPETRYLKSKNKLLYATGSGNKITIDGNVTNIKYEGATGIKTGYTPEASNCLVSSASRNGQNLIAVVYYDPGNNLYIDSHNLLDYGFENFTNKKVAFKNEFIENIPIEHGSIPFVTAIVGEDISASIANDKAEKLKRNILLNDKITAPITKNQILGKIEYSIDNKILTSATIIAADSVDQKAIFSVVNTTQSGIVNVFTKWWFWLIIVFILWRLYIYRRRKKRRRRFKSKYKLKG